MSSLCRMAAGFWLAVLAGSLSSGQESQQKTDVSGQAGAQESRETRNVQRRIPRQQALLTAALDGIVRGTPAAGGEARPVAGARITLRNLQSGQAASEYANGEGVFRVLSIAPGHYELRVEAENFSPFAIFDLGLNANEVTTL